MNTAETIRDLITLELMGSKLGGIAFPENREALTIPLKVMVDEYAKRNQVSPMVVWKMLGGEVETFFVRELANELKPGKTTGRTWEDVAAELNQRKSTLWNRYSSAVFKHWPGYRK